jgi:integrase
LGEDSITIDERFSRGAWGKTKTDASNATIAVDSRVIQRIQQLKGKEVTINWGAGGAKKTFQLVRSTEPGDLVFQSLTKGSPMSDQNVLRRHIKPVARKLGIPGLNWQVLRRSYATWLVQSGADVKSVQGQMRHTDPKLAMQVYAQVVPASQRKAVTQMMYMLDNRRVPVNVQ